MNAAASFSTQYEEAGRIEGQPIPIRPSVPQAGEYPIEALSPKLQDAARAIVDKVQLPAAIAAQSVLAAAALTVQPFLDVELPTGEVVPTSLFLISVAASGDRKSSADKLALHPIRLREREMHSDYAGAQASYTADNAAYTAARKKAAAGNKSRAQIKQELEACGPEPTAPAIPLLISDEGTLQGLQRAFAESMPSLGLFSDEGGQWLGGYAMNEENRGATGAALSKLWEGAPIKRVRGTEGVSILRGRRLSLHLMIQPRIAQRLFGDPELRDQGLLSRLLVCAPQSMKGERFWHNSSDDSRLGLEKYEARVIGLLRSAMPMDPDTRELKPRAVPLSAEARELFVHWHDAVETELKQGGAFEAVAGFAAKLPEHSVRIAAVMAYFEDRNLTEISDRALSAGIKVAKFHAEEALRLFGLGSVDPETETAAQIIDWIRKERLHIVGGRLLSRYGPGRQLSGPVRQRALQALVEMKHLVQIGAGAEVTHKGKTEFNREAYTVVADAPDMPAEAAE